jgi:hypothetical protein
VSVAISGFCSEISRDVIDIFGTAAVWNQKIVYAYIASKDKQLQITIFMKIENANVGGISVLKLIFCFMETTHKPLHCTNILRTEKYHRNTRKSYFNRYFVWRNFNMTMV